MTGDFLKLLEEEDAAKREKNDPSGFKEAAGPVKPLSQDKITQVSPLLDQTTAKIRQEAAERMPQKEAEGASSAFVAMVGPNETLEFKRNGVQPYLLKKLRSGEYLEADFLDLHGCTLEKAYKRVMDFISFAREHEYRCILIIHGKGEKTKKKALLKSYVAHWLKQLPEVLAFHSAPEWKGGAGALMIILKKGDKASALNREEYARRPRGSTGNPL